MTPNFDVFFICAWTNGWVNYRVAGDLRRHRAHYDVTLMLLNWRRGDHCNHFQTHYQSHDVVFGISVIIWHLVFGLKSQRSHMYAWNGNIFRVTGLLCGEFTGPGEFPTQRPVTRSFDVYFDLRLNKWLSKQPQGWWLETPSWSLWHHCNGAPITDIIPDKLFMLPRCVRSRALCKHEVDIFYLPISRRGHENLPVVDYKNHD